MNYSLVKLPIFSQLSEGGQRPRKNEFIYKLSYILLGKFTNHWTCLNIPATMLWVNEKLIPPCFLLPFSKRFFLLPKLLDADSFPSEISIIVARCLVNRNSSSVGVERARWMRLLEQIKCFSSSSILIICVCNNLLMLMI